MLRAHSPVSRLSDVSVCISIHVDKHMCVTLTYTNMYVCACVVFFNIFNSSIVPLQHDEHIQQIITNNFRMSNVIKLY